MNPTQAPLLSLTEIPNELTHDIDIASPKGIVQLLRQSDAQMFAGYSTYPGLMDPETLEQIERCVAALAGLLRARGRRRVVIAGAGTSGRLAAFVCRQFNLRLERLGHVPPRPADFRQSARVVMPLHHLPVAWFFRRRNASAPSLGSTWFSADRREESSMVGVIAESEGGVQNFL